MNVQLYCAGIKTWTNQMLKKTKTKGFTNESERIKESRLITKDPINVFAKVVYFN